MSKDTRAELQALKDSLIISGTKQTTAANLRAVFDVLIQSLSNILDDKDQPNGYLGIESDGTANVSLIKSATPSGKFLRDNGTFDAPLYGGTFSVNGNSSTVTFQVNHGLGFAPSVVVATPMTQDSAATHWIENFTASSFDITFKIAPPSGTKNIKFNYLIIV